MRKAGRKVPAGCPGSGFSFTVAMGVRYCAGGNKGGGVTTREIRDVRNAP